jgi:chromosome partitioning protein
MKTILIANPKGGSGKTTLATNIAGYLASTGAEVCLLDLDRQQSATLWRAQRSSNLPPIRDGSKHTEDTGWLVIDSPAAMRGKKLDRALKEAELVIVPVAPSLYDIQASYDFLCRLSRLKVARKGRIKIGVVGIRLTPHTRSSATLENFLQQLELPVLACLRETQVYVNAAYEGKSLFDLPPSQAAQDIAQWSNLLAWLNDADAA